MESKNSIISTIKVEKTKDLLMKICLQQCKLKEEFNNYQKNVDISNDKVSAFLLLELSIQMI